MDEERSNDSEVSKFLKNEVQVDRSAESSADPNCVTVTDSTAQHNAVQQSEPFSEEPNHGGENGDTVRTKPNSACTEEVKPSFKSSGFSDNKENSGFNSAGENSTSNENLSKAVVKISKPLCANYRSGSDTDSLDSESDSSTSSDETSETFSENEDEGDVSHDSDTVNDKTANQKEKKAQGDLSMLDLPPIEDLKITVPENACVEVGRISGIVDALVVVESYKGTAALDIDTVLFLDCGKRTLGKVFDVLGPITEPVYTVRFNNPDQIKSLSIEKEQKVYYAPKTQHTTFVFLSEVLKNKGSDASWKDNVEAPSEFQDFSDDEQERLHKDKQKREGDGEGTCLTEANKSRKRSFSRTKQTSGILQPSRFRHPGGSGQRRPSFPRNLSPNQFVPPPSFPTPIIPNPGQVFPYNIPPYPGTNVFATAPHLYYPPRFSGPSFPPFGGLPFAHRPFHQPFFQQRSHSFRQPMGGMWGRPMFRPPPPPPPPDGQNDQEHSDGKPT